MNNDLISRKVLKNLISDKSIPIKFEEEKRGEWQCSSGVLLSDIYKTIDNAPTVEVIPLEVHEKAMDVAVNDLFKMQEELNRVRNEKRTQGEWIPVSERLPDKNIACLVTVGKLNLVQIAIYSDLMETIDHKIFYQGDYGKNNFQNITEYVKAWQPLPEPYKKEGESDADS